MYIPKRKFFILGREMLLGSVITLVGVVGAHLPWAIADSAPTATKSRPPTVQDHGTAKPASSFADSSIPAILQAEIQPADFVYNPTGKRDPFAPLDFSQPAAPLDPRNPLTGFDYKELRLTSVLAGGNEPLAIVEDSAGRGFTVRQGTRIGKSGGEVIEIQRDKLVIQEPRTDSRGGKHTERIELSLRAAKAIDQESGSRRSR